MAEHVRVADGTNPTVFPRIKQQRQDLLKFQARERQFIPDLVIVPINQKAVRPGEAVTIDRWPGRWSARCLPVEPGAAKATKLVGCYCDIGFYKMNPQEERQRMTCIVGLISDASVHIGGDSAGVAGYSLTVRADRKVFRNQDFLFGFTSSFRMGQLLAHSFKPPKRDPETDVYAFMVTDFVDALRQCLKDGGYARRQNEAERGGTFLVGYAGRLFRIDDDYQVVEPVDGFDACGCGQQIALGALFASSSSPPRERLEMALNAAERFSAGVRGPFHFETLNLAP
ncbi:hypothetical protein ACXHXG_19580 [Rhizobium sp. LEGMi198b]